MHSNESLPVADEVGPRRVWRRLLAWTGVALLLLVAACACRLYWMSQPANAITIGPDTTVIDGPPAPDGLVDYVAAMNERWSAGVTPADNAVVALVQAFGPEVIDVDLRASYFEFLGIAAPAAVGDYFINDTEFFLRRHNPADKDFEVQQAVFDEQLHEVTSRPWRRHEYPEFAEWVDANSGPLELIREATLRPRFYRPVLTRLEQAGDSSDTFPESHASRDVARLLSARSMLLIGEGDTDGACRNLLLCHRLSRVLGRGGTDMDVLVAHAVDAVACHGDAALLGCLGLTPEQARLYLADLTALPPLPSFAEAIDVAERFRTIDEIQAMVRGGEHARDWDLEALGALHNAAIDWSLVLRRTNEYCDNIVAALRLTRYADRAARLQEIELEFDAEEAQLGPLRPIWSALLLSGRESVSRKFALKWLDESMGAPSSLCALEACAVARLQLSRLGFALAAYHADHGAFPESLGALVPENLSAAPLDPYTDLPFVYERNDDGYRLYSVGENMLDDGGRTFDSEPRGDDILIEVPRRARPATGTHSATP